STSDGTAMVGVDYSNVVRTIVFGANETNKTVSIPIINDTLDETNETILLALRNPTGGASLGPRSTAVLTIQDNDAGGAISFSLAKYSVSETASNAIITVTRSGGSAGAVTVDFATINGTATAGEDYTDASATLHFEANQLTQTVMVPISDDLLAE